MRVWGVGGGWGRKAEFGLELLAGVDVFGFVDEFGVGVDGAGCDAEAGCDLGDGEGGEEELAGAGSLWGGAGVLRVCAFAAWWEGRGAWDV